ncbi:MAG: pyridoxamine 5'-phosphate oxidase family protein [Actinobacteria bacterium]|nr:pyridoxamine 5'-phosphate oxidase family protein [Actinomycetota bacterium]
MNETIALQRSLDLLENAKAAILTTIDLNGFPQTRAMFNLRRADQFPEMRDLFQKNRRAFEVFFTTNTSSTKVSHLIENPKASVYYCRPSEFRGLMLSGEIDIVTDKLIREAIWQEGWEMYYPGGPNDPDHTVLHLRPSIAKYYHQLSRFTFDLREMK